MLLARQSLPLRAVDALWRGRDVLLGRRRVAALSLWWLIVLLLLRRAREQCEPETTG